jgi:hypothetical protein
MEKPSGSCGQIPGSCSLANWISECRLVPGYWPTKIRISCAWKSNLLVPAQGLFWIDIVSAAPRSSDRLPWSSANARCWVAKRRSLRQLNITTGRRSARLEHLDHLGREDLLEPTKLVAVLPIDALRGLDAHFLDRDLGERNDKGQIRAQAALIFEVVRIYDWVPWIPCVCYGTPARLVDVLANVFASLL